MTDKEAFDLIAAHAVPGAPSVETIVALKSDEQASLSPGAYQVLTAAVKKRDVVGLLRGLERQGEDNIWRVAEQAREEIQNLREWAKLAFRALNHVGPALLHQECETKAERELVDRVIEMAEAAAQQYAPIAGVNYIDAVHDARDALKDCRECAMQPCDTCPDVPGADDLRLMRQAMDALISHRRQTRPIATTEDAIEALRKRLGPNA